MIPRISPPTHTQGNIFPTGISSISSYFDITCRNISISSFRNHEGNREISESRLCRWYNREQDILGQCKYRSESTKMDKRHHTCVQTRRMYNSKGELYSQLWAEVTTKQHRDLSPGKHAIRSRVRGDGNGCPCVRARKTWKLSLPLKFSVNI